MTEKPRGSHHSEARTKSLVNHRADEMTRRQIPRLLLALLALLALPLAIVASGEPLHIGNFQRTLDADELWVVEFMSPMCGTCQTFRARVAGVRHETRARGEAGAGKHRH
jgi:hypothetical protein